MLWWGVVVLASLSGGYEVDNLSMDVPASSKRCFGEQFPDLSLGKFSFRVVGDEPDKVRVTVKDPKKKLLYSTTLSESVEFPFTTKVPGLHKACLENRHTKPQRVEFTVSQGFPIKEYKHSEKEAGPISKQLQEAAGLLGEISREMDMSLTREERELEEATRTEAKLATLGYCSIAILLALAIWQIIYLRSFFRSKKLL